MDDYKWAAVVSAIANSISAIAVIFAMLQLLVTRRIAQMQFEDGLAKEYRELATRIPTKALIGAGLSPRQYEDTFDELFRYLDLSNEQISLRSRGRIRDQTWAQWSEGIHFNMKLPVFSRAWADVQQCAPTQFSELARFLSEDIGTDPKNWSTERK
jgi:hypothetical protein